MCLKLQPKRSTQYFWRLMQPLRLLIITLLKDSHGLMVDVLTTKVWSKISLS